MGLRVASITFGCWDGNVSRWSRDNFVFSVSIKLMAVSLGVGIQYARVARRKREGNYPTAADSEISGLLHFFSAGWKNPYSFWKADGEKFFARRLVNGGMDFLGSDIYYIFVLLVPISSSVYSKFFSCLFYLIVQQIHPHVLKTSTMGSIWASSVLVLSPAFLLVSRSPVSESSNESWPIQYGSGADGSLPSQIPSLTLCGSIETLGSYVGSYSSFPSLGQLPG